MHNAILTHSLTFTLLWCNETNTNFFNKGNGFVCSGLNALFDFGKTDGVGKCSLSECAARPNVNTTLKQSLLIHMDIWKTAKAIPKLCVLEQTACEG